MNYRRIATFTGWLWLITFLTSIPGRLFFYAPVLQDEGNYVTGAGADAQRLIAIGALLEGLPEVISSPEEPGGRRLARLGWSAACQPRNRGRPRARAAEVAASPTSAASGGGEHPFGRRAKREEVLADLAWLQERRL